jgi:hypothetical protein
MAQALYGLDKTFIANAAFNTTTALWRVMYAAGSDTAGIVNTTTCNVIGILQNANSVEATGGAAIVRLLGTSKAICGVSVGVGALVIPNTAGAIIPIGTVTGTAYPIVGVALENGSTNSVIEIVLQPTRAQQVD